MDIRNIQTIMQKEIYQNFFAQARSKSQIVIHRDKELMYYGYIRQLDKYSQYIGFCVTSQWHECLPM